MSCMLKAVDRGSKSDSLQIVRHDRSSRALRDLLAKKFMHLPLAYVLRCQAVIRQFREKRSLREDAGTAVRGSVSNMLHSC